MPKITLRDFLAITNTTFILPYACKVYVDEYDKNFEEYFPKQQYFDVDTDNKYLKQFPKNIEQLEPYMDYEIYKFRQDTSYGEIDYQTIYLRHKEVNQ